MGIGTRGCGACVGERREDLPKFLGPWLIEPAVMTPFVRVKPVIDSVFPLAEAAAAHARMESGEHIGKIVLEVGK